MQVDTILSVLAIARQRLMRIDGPYTADQAQHRLRIISVMRDYALAEDGTRFASYCQRTLMGTDGDIMCDLLEELYEDLGKDPEVCMWDEFEMEFLQ
jgi:hypothetical protein